jgi:ribonuclease HII
MLRAPEPPGQNPHLHFESGLWSVEVRHIAGVDEAGRGAIAGPVVAAAVILPPLPGIKKKLQGVRDSKQMTPRQRRDWSQRVRQIALAWAVGFASCQEIDRLGILPATHLSVQRALDELAIEPQHLLLDYVLLRENPTPQTSLTRGDARSLTIAAASILAKTARDEFMCRLDPQYPEYGFAGHKGYGTQAHREAVAALGPTPLHRLSFSPLRGLAFPAGHTNRTPTDLEA